MSALLNKYITTKTSSVEAIDVEDFEIGEALQEASEASSDLEALHAGFDQLGQYAQALEGFEEPLTAREYALMHVAIENLDAGFVITDMESFEGGESSRAAAHEQALESIGESLKKFWQGIKNAFFRAWNAVKDFFAKLFGGSKKLLERITKVQTAAKEKGVRESDKKVKVGGLSKIWMKGKEGDAMVSEGITAIFQKLEPNLISLTELLNDIAFAKIAKSLTDVKDEEDETKVKALWEKAFNFSLIEKKNSEIVKDVVKNENIMFPGGMVVKVSDMDKDVKLDGSTEDLVAVVSRATRLPSITITREEQFKGKESDLQEPMSVSTIDLVWNLVNKVEKTMETRDAKVKEIEKASKDSIKVTDALIDASEKGTIGKFWTAGRVRRIASANTRVATSSIDRYISYTFSVARAYVAYAEASVK